MAIQMRRGVYDRFDPDQMRPGEWAVVLSGDSTSVDGMACYMCFAAGVVKRMATFEDMAANIANADAQIVSQLTEGVRRVEAAIGAAEALRATAEQGRASAEQDRVAAEQGRVDAEEERSERMSRVWADPEHPNLTPFFSEPADSDYWLDSSDQGEHTGDGWMHVQIDEPTTEGDILVALGLAPNPQAFVSPGKTYTLLVEFANFDYGADEEVEGEAEGETETARVQGLSTAVLYDLRSQLVPVGRINYAMNVSHDCQFRIPVFFEEGKSPSDPEDRLLFWSMPILHGKTGSFDVRASIYEGEYEGEYNAYDGNNPAIAKAEISGLKAAVALLQDDIANLKKTINNGTIYYYDNSPVNRYNVTSVNNILVTAALVEKQLNITSPFRVALRSDSQNVAYASGRGAVVVPYVPNSLSVDGMVFLRWNTEADGSGTDYYPGNIIFESDGVSSLYAMWDIERSVEIRMPVDTTWDEHGIVDYNMSLANLITIGGKSWNSHSLYDYEGSQFRQSQVGLFSTLYDHWGDWLAGDAGYRVSGSTNFASAALGRYTEKPTAEEWTSLPDVLEVRPTVYDRKVTVYPTEDTPFTVFSVRPDDNFISDVVGKLYAKTPTGYKVAAWEIDGIRNDRFDQQSDTFLKWLGGAVTKKIVPMPIFEPILHTVAFKTNISNPKPATSIPNTTYLTGEEVTFPSYELSTDKYTPWGWYSKIRLANGEEPPYLIGETYILPATNATSTVLYAISKPKTFTLQFDANGGTGSMDPITATHGVRVDSSVSTFAPPQGKTFSGWNTEADGSGYQAAAESGKITAAKIDNLTDAYQPLVTLYAQWVDA